jgi:ABC-2 type transport system ATP-binding protein
MTDSAIVANDISKRFGQVVAVNNLSLRIPTACIYGFLGPNGSGKSTTIRMLTGLLQPTSGTVKVLNYELPRQAEKLRLKIGYMTQKFSLYNDLTVLENLKLVAKIYSLSHHQEKKRVEELLSTYNLIKLKNQMTQGLSGGQKQRLALACAILHEPDLLFLDEPTSAVDPENRRDFWESLFDLCNAGKTILVSTHYMDEAERCHYLAILENGNLRGSDSPEELMRKMQANIIEIGGSGLRLLKEKLLAYPQIISVAQQGIRLRVLIHDDIQNPVDWLKNQLDDLTSREIEQVRPSLEDVFVKYTQRETTC